MRALVCVLALVVLAVSVQAAQQATDSYYVPDRPFPEFMGMWQEGWSFKGPDNRQLVHARPGMPLGGYVHVYFRNTGVKPLTVVDLAVEGVKLSEGLKANWDPPAPDKRFQASVLLSKLPAKQISLLRAAGTPVWWKAEPLMVPPGGLGEIVLRLKRDPQRKSVSLTILTDAQPIMASVPVGLRRPAFETISFAPGLSTIYAYARHPERPGLRPVRVLLDGVDVTRSCSIASDALLDLSPIVIRLAKPLRWMSYHQFKAVYGDGSSAVAGIRAWGREMVYGMWAAAGDMGTTEADGRERSLDWTNHNLNAIMGMYTSDANPWFFGDKGWVFTESIGLSRMMHWVVKGQKPVFLFLMDEPDACDASTGELPATERLGTNGQWAGKWCNILHKFGSESPVLLNVNGTYKPENYYTYHQLADIPCIDPYYQAELDLVYQMHPDKLPWYSKPTYVYATSTVSQSAAAPKPLHVILCSTKYIAQDGSGFVGRYPTPEEKRAEAYYAVAAGAKGLSYWWFSPDAGCRGCGTSDPEARALYREIGLLGAELRTAGSIITACCPIKLKTEATRLVWVRTVAAGTSTIGVIAVNDRMLCDRAGTLVKPISNVSIAVQAPSWLSPKEVFEVTADGLKDVTWKREPGKLRLELGELNVSRFVIVTSDTGLRARLQDTYESQFAGNVKALKAAGHSRVGGG